MGHLDHTSEQRRAGSRTVEYPSGFDAIIANTAASVGDVLHVTIPSVDGGTYTYQAVAWTPRVDDAGATVLPTAGDRALVVFSEQREPWIVTWLPNG